MTPEQTRSSAGTPRGCLPFMLAGGLVLAAIALGTVFLARQIEIGPFDEEGEPGVQFETAYVAFIAKVDRTDEHGRHLTQPLAILRRDRENYHLRKIRQAGDTRDAYFASEAKRVELSRADLSISDVVADRLLSRDVKVRVLVHSRIRDSRLLVGVSLAPAGRGEP